MTATGSQLWSQNSAGIGGSSAAKDAFGSALAIADLGMDPAGDLAVGTPGDIGGGGLTNVGAVHVIYGDAATGLSATGSQYWTQQSSGIADASESGDRFGTSLAAGKTTSGVQADLAIGATGENAGAGVVHLLRGAAGGATATGSQYWTQNSTGVADSQEPGDHFGASLLIASFSGGVPGGLAIGAPDEDSGAPWTRGRSTSSGARRAG